MLQRLPMIAQLFFQVGLEAGALLEPSPVLVADREQKTYNVFHVAEAAGSPFVPDQDRFVQPFGVRSVLGFGGVVPGGDLFAVILFTRVPVARPTAELFKPLALNVKLAVLPFLGDAARPGVCLRMLTLSRREKSPCSRPSGQGVHDRPPFPI